MKLNNVFKNGIYFIILWLLVQTQWRVSSFKIIRGDIDKLLYCEDDHGMVKLTDNLTINCDGSQSCQCNWRDGYNTVIYNRNTSFIKCVKDEDEAMDMNVDGKYLMYCSCYILFYLISIKSANQHSITSLTHNRIHKFY